MPVGTPFVTKHLTDGADTTWNQLPLVSGNTSVVRRNSIAAVGYPYDITASGKAVAATSSRPFVVDQFSVYVNATMPTTFGGVVVPAAWGVGITFNLPRDPGLAEAAMTARMRNLLGHGLQYLVGASWSAANVTALAPLITLGQLPFALNGIR